MQPLPGLNPSSEVMLQAKKWLGSTEMGWGSGHCPQPGAGSIAGEQAPRFPLCLIPFLIFGHW